jgi:hypothetical protein
LRSLFIGKKTVHRQVINYYMLIEERADDTENYGVELACANGERAQICRVTPSQNRALGLVSQLMRYAVTPVTLHDIVEDWLQS